MDRNYHTPLGVLLQQANRLFVIDCPPLDPKITVFAVEQADLVIVPMIPSPLDVRAAAPFLKEPVDGRKRQLVVLNQVKPRTTTARLAREPVEQLGVHVARTELGSRIAHLKAALARQAVTDFAPGSRAAQEVTALAREVIARLNDCPAAACRQRESADVARRSGPISPACSPSKTMEVHTLMGTTIALRF